jgi:2-keto-4-pentenoate hydratase
MRVTSPVIEAARIEATAMMLMEEHATRKQFRSISGERGIHDLDGAYKVQEALVRRLLARENAGVCGFKIGLTSRKMQEMCGIDSPLAGYVLDNRIHQSGVTLKSSSYGRLGLEFEIAVQMARDFPFRPIPYTPEEIGGAVAAVAAGVEVVDDRNADYTDKLDVLSLIADNSWNEGAVLGPWVAPPRDLAAVEGVVACDRDEIGRGFGRDALGHPYIPLTWLANHQAKTGRPLKAGDIVMTGSIVRTQFPPGSCRYRYELDGVGTVEVEVRV